MRRVVMDTETTGLELSQGHRVVEIGCVELIGRRITGAHLHHYLNPERDIDEAAMEVHGITAESLRDKPRFADVAEEVLEFIDGAELLIHNAPFDVGFLDSEFRRAGKGKGVVEKHCSVLDTLVLARREHPGQRNSLDALCKRYGVDNTQRTLHGALLDAEILADVFLAMTRGQTNMSMESGQSAAAAAALAAAATAGDNIAPVTTIITLPTEEERAAHDRWLQLLEKSCGEAVIWRQLAAEGVIGTAGAQQ